MRSPQSPTPSVGIADAPSTDSSVRSGIVADYAENQDSPPIEGPTNSRDLLPEAPPGSVDTIARQLDFDSEHGDFAAQADTLSLGAPSTVSTESDVPSDDNTTRQNAIAYFNQFFPRYRKNPIASFISIHSAHCNRSKDFIRELHSAQDNNQLFNQISEFKKELSAKGSRRTLKCVDDFLLGERSCPIKDKALSVLDKMPKTRSAIPLFSGYNRKLIEEYTRKIQSESVDTKVIEHLLELQNKLINRKSHRCENILTDFIRKNNLAATTNTAHPSPSI